ncbi:MAG: ACP phosphodiesterase [Flavipsychrobacter sp.]
MNFLGHAFLSFGDAEILTGNMIGDFVKGKIALTKYPEKIQQGILLHRAIDEFADKHPASLRAKVWFRSTYGLYSGAIVDILYDHFLANDPKHFLSDEDLMTFSKETYQNLFSLSAHFPKVFANMFPHMQENNWLYNYRNLKGMDKALRGLKHRAQYMPNQQEAYNIFIAHYYQIAQCYYEFMDDAINFVKIQLNQSPSL